jgi:dihydrofolate reductase
MRISLLVAAAENNTIGKDGQLPWHLPNDLKMFKNLTWAMPVIMGRKTYESLGKPLKGRVNIVLTTRPEQGSPGIEYAASIDEALSKAASTGCKEVFVIGGGTIYEQFFSRADRIYLTRVHASVEGDTFFPVLDPALWEQDGHLDFLPDEKHAYAYSFQRWKRK